MDEDRRSSAPETSGTEVPGGQDIRRVRVAQAAKVASAFGDLVTPGNIVLLVALAVLFMIGLFGGWDKLAEKQEAVPVLSPNEAQEAHPLKVEVREGYWFTDLPALRPLLPGQRGLMLLVDVTNTSSQPVTQADLWPTFQLSVPGLLQSGQSRDPETGVVRPSVVRAADLLPAYTVQPGLPTRLALFWVQDASQPAPREVTVHLFKQTYRRWAISGNMRYLDPTEVAQVRLPVTRFTGAQ